MGALHKHAVYTEYVINGKSDREIASLFKVHRTTISKFRKYHGITTRQYSGEVGERLVEQKLIELGASVVIAESSFAGKHSFDMLVNDKIRVQVKASQIHHRRWTFPLTNKDGDGINGSSGDHIKLKNGRWKKNFSKTCDLIILCCITNDEPCFYIVPSSIKLPNTINIPLTSGHTWERWKDRWDLLSLK